MIIKSAHDVAFKRRYCSDFKKNTFLFCVYVTIKRLGSRVLVGSRNCFVIYTVCFCHINFIAFDLSFMYTRDKIKVVHELVTHCEDTQRELVA